MIDPVVASYNVKVVVRGPDTLPRLTNQQIEEMVTFVVTQGLQPAEGASTGQPTVRVTVEQTDR